MLPRIILSTFLTLSIAITSQALQIKTISNKTTTPVKIKLYKYEFESYKLFSHKFLLKKQESYSLEKSAIFLSEGYPIVITINNDTFELINNNTIVTDCSKHSLYNCSATDFCYPAHLLKSHDNPCLTRTLACAFWSCCCCFCFNLVSIEENPQLTTTKEDTVCATQPAEINCTDTGKQAFDLVISLDAAQKPVFTFN